MSFSKPLAKCGGEQLEAELDDLYADFDDAECKSTAPTEEVGLAASAIHRMYGNVNPELAKTEARLAAEGQIVPSDDTLIRGVRSSVTHVWIS